MGEFFNRWRRKFGLVTLVMACVFAGGWVRSVTIYEDATFLMSSKSQLFIESGDGIFSFGRLLAHDPEYFSTQPKTDWHRFAPHQHIREGWESLRWYWRFSNVGIGGHHSGVAPQIDDLLLVVMPYWAITVPLTLISLWLLLSKPRTSTPMKITEPTPAEGT